MLMIHLVLRVGMPQGLYGWLESRHMKSVRGDEERVVPGKLKGSGMGGLELTFEGGLKELWEVLRVDLSLTYGK